jgi:hypothetical protein
MDPHVGEVDADADEQEERLERVAAIDVAKASGKVCTRVPHASIERRRVTKVWDVATTTNALMNLGDQLAEMGIERVVVESTSDYWRPFFYLLEARGLVVWLVNARDVKAPFPNIYTHQGSFLKTTPGALSPQSPLRNHPSRRPSRRPACPARSGALSWYVGPRDLRGPEFTPPGARSPFHLSAKDRSLAHIFTQSQRDPACLVRG